MLPRSFLPPAYASTLESQALVSLMAPTIQQLHTAQACQDMRDLSVFTCDVASKQSIIKARTLNGASKVMKQHISFKQRLSEGRSRFEC